MASNAAAGDPRVRATTNPRLASREDDIRKRQASQSPACGARPASKKSTQTGQQLPPINDAHARKPSVTSSDPRRSNVNSPAGSRRNSVSLNTNGINGKSAGSKQINGQNGNASPSGILSSSGASTPQASTAPIAFMSSAPSVVSPPANVSPDLHAAVFTALMGVSDQACELASRKETLKLTEIALVKARREHDAMHSHFAQFPAIKEQKTTARNIAQANYDEAQRSFQQARALQEQVVGAAATTIAGMQTSPAASTKQVSLSEFYQVKTLAGQGVKAQSQVAVLEGKIASVTERLDEALSKAEGNKATQPTTEQLAALEARVSEAHALATRSQAPVPQQPPAAVDTAELAELKGRVDDLEQGQNDQIDLLEKHADAKVAQVEQWAQTEIEALKANVAEATAAQNANARELNDCLSSLDSLRTSVAANTSQSVSPETLRALDERITALTHKVNNLPPTNQATPPAPVDPSNPLGLKQFKPVKEVIRELQPAPENPTCEILPVRPAVGVHWNDWIENHIGGLKQTVGENTKRLDNVSTDEIHDAMMRVMKEKYNKEYPNLLTWQASVDLLKKEIQQLKADIAQLHAIHSRDVGQLRADTASLTQRVEDHENAVAQGEQKFTEIASEYRAISQDVLQLQGAQQKALERALDNATS